MMSESNLEAQLAEQAAYHVGLFSGLIAERHGADLCVVAHALWLLAREAERRREEWLAASGDRTVGEMGTLGSAKPS